VPEEFHGVAGKTVLADDDGVPLKKSVGLVARQEELKESGVQTYRVPFSHLPWVSESDVLRECQFAKSHQCEESDAELGVEEEVVMGNVVVVR
jgi:hypothetical protein